MAKTRLVYFAARRMTTNVCVREPGDEVPEAKDWKNLRSYVSSGRIRVERVPDDGKPAKKRKVKDLPPLPKDDQSINYVTGEEHKSPKERVAKTRGGPRKAATRKKPAAKKKAPAKVRPVNEDKSRRKKKTSAEK